jgi:tetratricopeptide (TPR) repeat protein
VTQFSHDIFVSHSSCDKPVVRKIAERLRENGLRVWFDEWSIPIGADISAAVEDGLQQSRTLLLCISKKSLNSDWVNAERSTAMFRDPMNRDRRFIPALIDDCADDIPDALKRFRYADLRNHSKAEIDELCKACQLPKDKIRVAQWKFKIEGDLNEFDKQRLDDIVDQIRSLSGDIDVVLRRIDPANSVLLTFEGTVEGFDQLRRLFTRGELSKLLGEEVLSIQIDGLWTTDDVDRSTPIYDLIDKASKAYRRRDYDSALRHYREALKLAQEMEFLKPLGSIYCNIGFIYENRDELNEATRMHRAAIEADERTENNEGLANHCYNLGRIYRMLNENEMSQHYYRRALQLARDLNDSQRVSKIESLLRVRGEDGFPTG